jgi:hypothetical protein
MPCGCKGPVLRRYLHRYHLQLGTPTTSSTSLAFAEVLPPDTMWVVRRIQGDG